MIRLLSRWKSSIQKDQGDNISNPGRGFYLMERVVVEDEGLYEPLITPYVLTLIELNLKKYNKGAISDKGLAMIDHVLEQLPKLGKLGLIRFLYDWEGEAWEKEPDSKEIVLLHMDQLKPILLKNANNIFLLQGIFLGNWGEMHSSPLMNLWGEAVFMDKLASVTDSKTYLSVRTPSQWRTITGITDLNTFPDTGHPYAARLGLFNDAFMASDTDLGTYSTGEGVTALCKQSRKKEYAFQNKLCKHVPNGGETAAVNELVAPQRFSKEMFELHITYLSADHCLEVIELWRNSNIKGSKTNYLDYIEGHIGYRFSAEAVRIKKGRDKGKIFEISIKNTGTAPTYLDALLELICCKRGEEQILFAQPESEGADLKALYPSSSMAFSFYLPDIGLKGEHDIYLKIKTKGGYIRLANRDAFTAEFGANFLGVYKF